jgi:uncharacterized protein YabE (DUF348 family)
MRKYWHFLFILFGLLFFGYSGKINASENKIVSLNYNGLEFQVATEAKTVSDFLNEQKIIVNQDDLVFPAPEAKLYSGENIIIQSGKKITITADGQKVSANSQMKTVRDALFENKINLGEDDFAIPNLNAPLQNNAKIEVVRVDIREEVINKDVDFEQQITKDDDLSWRTKKVSQKGVKGIDEYTYKVVSHNGKEISRKLLNKERIKDPVPEIFVQGTYMKLGKGKTGQGTWYAFKGGLFAASTTLSRGAYAKVTNTENGKTVVVQINDYGPQGKGRIIDLDKVAFEEIASLGAGVIGVKVEQVLN